MDDRRAFLRKLAKGAAYAAPVIYTLSTPRDLMAVITSGMIMLSNVQDSVSFQGAEGPAAPWNTRAEPVAPWAVQPPWARPPLVLPPGRSGGRE